MKTDLVFLCILFLLAGCKTVEAPPVGQKTETTTQTISPVSGPSDTSASSPNAPFSSTMEIPRGSSQNAAIAPQTTEPAAVVPEKPTKKDIQTALKNAGYYAGEIDGKFGPKTKKAVEDFQTANNLKVDGVAGPVTWNILKKYLNLETQK
jgi:peptidoglycan hydrolase-like protein with peptidoglycan-binding domain